MSDLPHVPLVPGYLSETSFGIRMDFGKHEGHLLEDVPSDYLEWCLREITDAPEGFHEALRAELHERLHGGVGAFDFEEGASGE